MTTSTSKQSRSLTPERIYDQLMSTPTAETVTLSFKDGRVLTGALIFNQLKGTGRLINVDEELSEDFAIDDIRDIRA